MHVYTMTYLTQHTSEVVRTVNETNEPAVILSHGHYVAMIEPITGYLDADRTLLPRVLSK